MDESGSGDLKTRARAYLESLATRGETVAYKNAAAALGIRPPYTIHQLTTVLEELMAEDAASGRPQFVAVVVSEKRGGVPAPGFFEKARDLGVYDGQTDPGEWHRQELGRVQEFVRGK